MKMTTNTNESTTSANCKLVPFSTFMKIRGTDKAYQEALEASSKFNKRLTQDRKTRIPFIDSQTRVAQTNSLTWYLPYQREKGSKPEQLYTYPVKSWVKKRRLQIDIDSALLRMPSIETQQQHQFNENSNSMDSIQPSYSSYNKYSSSLDHQQLHHSEESNSAARYMTDDWHMQEDSFDYLNDNENDNESDFDDYEDSKKKKAKKGGKGTGKKRSEITNEEKPFVCDKCGVKYKTKPGLNYHVQKMHSATSETSHVATSNQNHDASSASHTRAAKVSEYLNSDDNTNSLFDSAYDDSSSHHAPLQAPVPSQSQTMSGTSSSVTSMTAGSASHHHHPLTSSSSTTSSASFQAKTTNGNSKLCSTCGQATINEQLLEPNKKHLESYLVSCCECTRSYHPVCLSFTTNMILSVKKYNWQCIECKKCTICGNSENDDKLLFCDDCDRGYHMYCLNPPLSDAPDGDWRCKLCIQQFGPQ